MQISAANLLASQSQTSSRTQGTAAAFEPIAFKQTPPAAVSQDTVNSTATATAPAATPSPTRAATSANTTGSYVRPGTTIDIKI